MLLEENTHRKGIIAWEGIQVIDDVTNPAENPGIETLEGRIGPLMKGDGSQAHYIEMQPGLYCEQHPHSTESIIFTVKGRWVLCSGKRRHLMKPGTLFWFKKDTPTGYEVPFDDPAYILIFKGGREDTTDEEFFEYLRGLERKLRKQQDEGEPFSFEALPEDHPAKIFVRQYK